MSRWGGSVSPGGGDKTEDNEMDFNDVQVDEMERYNQDHILLLLDARESMLEDNGNGEPHLLNCFKLILFVMKEKIIARDNSSIGIILLGTEKSEGGKGYAEFLPLEVPSAANIRMLQSFIVNFETEFPEKFGSQSPENLSFPLRDTLWKCNAVFTGKAGSNKKKLNAKRVWLFTNDDCPNQHDPADQDNLAKVAQDSFRSGVEISLWHIGENFNVNKFYRRIILERSLNDADDKDNEEEDDFRNRVVGSTDSGFDHVQSNIKTKFKKKRRLFRGTMDLGISRCMRDMGNPLNAAATDYTLGVQFFRLFNIEKKPTSEKLLARNNEPVGKKSRYVHRVTAENVPVHQIKTYLHTTNADLPNVSMTSDELNIIKNTPLRRDMNSNLVTLTQNIKTEHNVTNSGDNLNTQKQEKPSFEQDQIIKKTSTDNSAHQVQQSCNIEILHYAPQSQLPDYLSLRAPYFITPDERLMSGSSRIFATLLKDLHAKKLLAVVRFNGRNSLDQPRLCVMIPQLELTDKEMDLQLLPPGFNLIILPFRNEIRANPCRAPSTVLEGLTEIPGLLKTAHSMVDALMLNTQINPSTSQMNDANEEHNDEDSFQLFDYLRIENPALQQFYKILQAVALSEEDYTWNADEDDSMQPDQKLFQNAQDHIKAFVEQVDLPENAASLSSQKRKASDGGMSAAEINKRTKQSELSKDFLQEILDTDLAELKLDGLKIYLKRLGLPLSGKKNELIERLLEGASEAMKNK